MVGYHPGPVAPSAADIASLELGGATAKYQTKWCSSYCHRRIEVTAAAAAAAASTRFRFRQNFSSFEAFLESCQN